jgi:hypothetical protein
MSPADLIKKINDLVGNVDYLPYNMSEVQVMFGAPPIPIKGLAYVLADHLQQQTRLIMGLSGTGVFVSNRNKSGIIEFGLLDGVMSNAAIQVLNLTGIPFPIAITDNTTGGTSTVLGAKCRLIKTPAWRRDRLPRVNIFTFYTDFLAISHGVRLSAD